VTTTVRPVSLDDVAELTRLVRANREFLAPWEPVRDEEFFTEDAQRELIRAALDSPASGPHVIELDGRIVGRINLNSIVRGPFQSSSLGYWVSQDVNGRGVATAAVAGMLRIAFGQFGLHRVEAGTLVHNTGSQRVLERNGFERFGLAPRYLAIAGQWQDHILFQQLNEERTPDTA
jgi:ribosomal-protein-alanine N-acetyltransferase